MEEKKNEKAKAEEKKEKTVKEKKVKEVKPKETKKEVKTPKKQEVKQEPKVEVKKEPKVEPKTEVKVEPKAEARTEVKIESKGENEVKEEAKPKFQKIEQPKPKKGKKRAALFFLLVIIIGAVAVAWIYVPEFRNLFNVNKDTTTNTVETNDISNAEEWEKAYIKILVEENNYKDVQDCKIQLINILEIDKIPTLLVTYTKSGENVLDIWQVDSDGQIVTKKDNTPVSGDLIKILYDVEKEEYNWYSYYENKELDLEIYNRLSRLIMPRVNSYKKLEEVDYKVSSKEDGGNTTREKFEQKVIEVDSKSLNKTWVDFASNTSKSEALKILESEYKKKRTAREVVKDSAKEDILDKAEEIQSKLNEPTMLDEETAEKASETETTTDSTATTDTPEANSDTQETTTENSKTDIGKDEALKLLEKKFGTNADGKKMGYYYLAWVKDDKANKYYAYQMSWLVDGHYSFVDTILVSADGKTYKEIGTPEDFTDGQTVTEFDSEKSF